MRKVVGTPGPFAMAGCQEIFAEKSMIIWAKRRENNGKRKNKNPFKSV
jgi:hypothetical protein